GTLVRPVWSSVSDEKDSFYVVRSTDNGKTWGEKIRFLPHDEYRAWPTLIRPLRDGRLVLFAGCWKRGDLQNGGGPGQNMTKMMFVSSDKGKTWSKPITLMPTSEGVCEESDFCELPNGDLFWVHRTEHFPDHLTERAKSPLAAKMGPNPPQSYCYSDRMQSIAHKKGKTFVPGQCEPAPFPHSGYPAVLYTKEGIILHLATDGVYWTADVGKTWTRLNIPGTPYYPKALQLKDGTIVCIGHVGSDDAYGTVDQNITQQTFRLKVQ
ncbi:MAG: exo-alpha-sialidase, partial [Candidatus Hydrogenedentes bacterium]|nr:exo-alpha-sialidase [Candidatus Hydrogenedentota bacterium]